MKTRLLFLLLISSCMSSAQYIGVRARYTETRLVDDAPNPPKRENRLVLSFFEVAADGTFTPVTLSNYDIWVYKQGLQYGNNMGGVLDSTGNNYPGYPWTAPKAVAYHNTLGANYIDCDPNAAAHYIVNGQELDCGFITVSYWDIDFGTGIPFEVFPAPNICLPWYDFPHPYFFAPGNVNFNPELVPGPPYNLYYFDCSGPLQTIRRGLLSFDSTGGGPVLPVRFANMQGTLNGSTATIQWSNMTETGIAAYSVERSDTGNTWLQIGTVMPQKNDGTPSHYSFHTIQADEKVFYRIKASELTGNQFYSSVIVLRKDNSSSAPQVSSTLTVYPNPVTGTEIRFQLTNATKGRYVSSIVTPDGKQIKQKMIEHNGGDLSRQIGLGALLPGIYQLIIRSATQKYSQQFIYGY